MENEFSKLPLKDLQIIELKLTGTRCSTRATLTATHSQGHIDQSNNGFHYWTSTIERKDGYYGSGGRLSKMAHVIPLSHSITANSTA